MRRYLSAGLVLLMSCIIPAIGSAADDAVTNKSAATAVKKPAAKPTAKAAKPAAKSSARPIAKKAAPKAKKKRKPAVKATPKAKDSVADAAMIAAETDRYKKTLAEHISTANPLGLHQEQPQALLRSVVVLRLFINAEGKLIKTQIQRSNGDAETEKAAEASLRSAAPLPKPPALLVRDGPLELSETWLFNSDGRFQIRSIAQKQKDE